MTPVVSPKSRVDAVLDALQLELSPAARPVPNSGTASKPHLPRYWAACGLS